METLSLSLFKLRLLFSLCFDMVWFGLKTVFGSGVLFFFLTFTLLVVWAYFLRVQTIREHLIQERYERLQIQRNYVWTTAQIQKWESVVSVIPSRIVYVYLAQLYEFIGQPEKADQALSQAKQIDPNYFFGHFPTSR